MGFPKFRAVFKGVYQGLCRVYIGIYRVLGFPKFRATFLGVPVIRIVKYMGACIGVPYLGKSPSRQAQIRVSIN